MTMCRWKIAVTVLMCMPLLNACGPAGAMFRSEERKCPPGPPGMVCIPGGKSIIGRKAERPGEAKAGARWVSEAWDGETSNVMMGNETPEHLVELDTFYIDRNEVTNAEFDKCVQAGGCKRFRNYSHRLYNGFRGPDQPAVPVSWKMAFDYCKWAGKRLPTEAEWEKVARGGMEATKYPWGNDEPDCSKANYRGCRKSGTDVTKNVGSYPPGHYGVFDMAGNGYEWVNDWASESREACGAACLGKNPQGPCSGKFPCKGQTRKVLKGGSFWWPAVYMTGTSRRLEMVESGGNRISFRCASSSPYLNNGPGWMIKDPLADLPDPAPPTAAELGIIRAIEFDVLDKPLCEQVAWSREDCKDPLSYVTSNESQHYLLKPYLKNLGGAYIGIAADANYSFIAWSRSRWAFLVDYDMTIIRLHKMLRALILRSDSPSEFLSYFTPRNEKKAEKIIGDACVNEKRCDRIVAVYKNYRERLYKSYARKAQPSPQFGEFGWLRNAEAFRYVKLMYARDRIVIVEADLLKDKAIRSVGDAVRKLGTSVRIYYPSNAEEMWKFNPNYRANVASLPFDERSVALRTIWASTYPRGRPQRFWHRITPGIYWHYVVHGALDYQKKIQYPDYDDVDAWREERISTPSPFMSVVNLPGDLSDGKVNWAKCER